jgi:hypothetical protein
MEYESAIQDVLLAIGSIFCRMVNNFNMHAFILLLPVWKL